MDKITIERETVELAASLIQPLTGKGDREVYDALRAALAAQPAEPVAWDAALNTLAQVFHNGEEAEGDDGAVMMVDLALWNEGCEALESLVSEDELAAPPAPAAVPLTDDQLRADLISCRGTVKADRNHYERLAEVHRGRITAAAYEAEASRLDALLERIDALIAVDKTKEQTP